MDMPSMEDMMSTLSVPSTPADKAGMEMSTHTEILLDILRTVTRIETKLDMDMASDSAEPLVGSPVMTSAMFDGVSQQLDFGGY